MSSKWFLHTNVKSRIAQYLCFTKLMNFPKTEEKYVMR